MNKYKIGKYIVKADSIYDAVTIVKTIKDSYANLDMIPKTGTDRASIQAEADKIAAKYGLTAKIKNLSGPGGGWPEITFTGTRENLTRLMKSSRYGYDKFTINEIIHDSVGSDLREYQKWVDYDMKKYGKISEETRSKIKKAGLEIIKSGYGDYEVIARDSLKKDSVTVRDIIQSLVDEETSAISSYNVALETLKDHIPAEAYEAIKAIRDDEQSHIENLYAVLNGNITPKNLEN